MSQSPATDIFAGLRVVDVSQGLAGPHAGALLAQYGAEVIKVEPPGGDWSRRLGAVIGETSSFFVAVNRGKLGVVLDLREQSARDILFRLCGKADVIIEAFRPGVAQRLGFGFDEVRAANNEVIYASVSGFGQVGPMRARPGTDSVVQAFSGMMSGNRGTLDGIPHRVPRSPLDMVTGLYVFQAITLAIYSRSRGFGGRYLDCSIMQTSACLNAIGLIEAASGKAGPDRPASPVGTFRTSDGWISIAIFAQAQWERFVVAIERPDLGADGRFRQGDDRLRNDSALNAELNSVFPEYTTALWIERLAAADLLAEKVQSYEEFLSFPGLRECSSLSWTRDPNFGEIPLVDAPGFSHGGVNHLESPGLGQHTREVLAKFGLEGPQEEPSATSDSGD